MKKLPSIPVHRGFALVEPLIVVAVLAIVATLATVALSDSKTRADRAAQDGSATILNHAIERAKLDGHDDPVLSGNDVEALAIWLLAHGYVR